MSEEKFNGIWTELENEITHLNQRIEAQSQDLKKIQEDVNTLKIQLALNDQKTNKIDKWSITIMSGIITILFGYIAVKLGLK